MNNRTTQLLQNYAATMAIVVYQSGSKEYYLESHPIAEDGSLQEGKPLKQETISDIIDFFFDERKNRSAISGFIPANLLGYEILPGGKYSMKWYRPAEQRLLHFSQSLHLPSGKAWVPPMVYQVEHGDLSVFAINNSDRPTEKTTLYHAPFHNIYNDGKVCLGSAKVSKPVEKTYQSEMKYWEDLFWLSEFSHLVGSNSPTKTNINMLWKSLIEDKHPYFPVEELIEFKKKSIKDLL